MERRLVFAGEQDGLTEVFVVDGHAPKNNMCHEYRVQHAGRGTDGRVLCEVGFQNGPVKEPGSKLGVQNEDLLKIVLHRLQGAQEGEFACRENQRALEGVEQALMYLNTRSTDRRRRSVEGLNKQ